jgi:hypothetical protein
VADRAQLHARLIEAQLGRGATPDPPAAFFTIGGVGAGKTTVLRPLVHAYREVVHGRTRGSLSRVAADEVREALPEYADGLGSTVVHAEALMVTYGPVYDAARSAGHDLVFDTIGTAPRPGDRGFEDSLRELKTDGFEIHVLLVQTPLDLCLERAELRALTVNGRLVDPDFVRGVHDQPVQALERLRATPGLLDGWIIVDGSGPGSAPSMLEGSASWEDQFPHLLDAFEPYTAS